MKHQVAPTHVLTHLSALPPTTDKLCVDDIKDLIQLITVDGSSDGRFYNTPSVML